MYTMMMTRKRLYQFTWCLAAGSTLELKLRIGQENDPIAKLTKFGWFLMSPGTEFDKNIMLFTQTSQSNCEELCRLNVLGLRDMPDHDQSMVFDEFKERLTR